MLCFVLVLSRVAPSAGGRARGARGSASDMCEGAATPCGATAPGRAGRAKKFKCDPRRGRELAAAREGSRAQEASAFKGPARPGRGFQQFSTEGTVPKLDLECVCWECRALSFASHLRVVKR